MGRLLRPRDLFRQRRLRQRVSRLALGSRRRRACAPRSRRFRPQLGVQEGRGSGRNRERRTMMGSKRAHWALVVVAVAALAAAATAAAQTKSAAAKTVV